MSAFQYDSDTDEDTNRQKDKISTEHLFCILNAMLRGQDELIREKIECYITEVADKHPLFYDIIHLIRNVDDAKIATQHYPQLPENANVLCEPSPYENENFEIMDRFADSLIRNGDMEVLKVVKYALYDFNINVNHALDPIIDKLTAWQIAKNNRGEQPYKVVKEYDISYFESLEGSLDDKKNHALLPAAICRKIRKDKMQTNQLLRIMREDIAPNTGRAGSKWKWSHVRKVMADEGIIPQDTNDTAFGRIIGAMNIGLTYERVRTNCKNNELHQLRQGCGRRYDYTDEFMDCVLCMEVAAVLKPVIEFVRE